MNNKIKRGVQKLRLFSQIRWLNREIANQAVPDKPGKPVFFFNASTRLEGLSLNGAYSMLSSWGIQMAGREVYHFACRSGMSHCVLAAGLGNPADPPPCKDCIKYTELFTGSAKRFWFEYTEDPILRELLDEKSVFDLMEVEYKGRPLGRLIVTSARWILRRYHLEDNDLTRYLLREFILSAHSIAEEYSRLLAKIQPGVVVVFNGLQYPEAVVRWMSKELDIRVITHEVNLQPYSAFFTADQATIYPMAIPADFQLSEHQDRILDQYLEKRFRGDFRMAGIKFWSAMDQLSEEFLEFSGRFDNLVPVFTNVIFDTSQAHANTLFLSMFEWLDLVVEVADQHPETLFVIRAHPDEMRKGKSSQESVPSWAAQKNLDQYSNILIVGPDETLSSYELIQRSKFTMVYNSSIGLEASLMGAPVLCAGKARYTQYPTVFYPGSRQEFENTLKLFLGPEEITVPAAYLQNARKFLFYQLFRASLPFGDLLRDHIAPGYVQLADLNADDFKPGASELIDTLVNGILEEGAFILESEDRMEIDTI